MPRTVSYLTVILHALTGGRAFDGDATSPVGFLKLTTVGRKSGQSRTAELIYIRDGDAYALTASNGGKPRNPGWFYNLQANPAVTIKVHGVRQRATAEVADPAKRDELWARLTQIAPMYKGYETRTQRVIPMVLVRPIREADA
ncbi:MAG TPA: nitroreductase family deazaflavin-dependent oxidoreductase [Ktedonobacterales bacterium]|jgi:deazaflavin-dependent oxidoreductase (nitroreductase family)|nr:nitroreductase family deazaflavin-dependent oxidoreductase [Ktedonobacterales bacterium]